MAIVDQFQLSTLEHRDAQLAHHRLGLSYTRSGYGSRIPTHRMVRLPGSPRWRRVYICQWSNSGTCYVLHRNGDWTVIY